jgi:hypothetical protein
VGEADDMYQYSSIYDDRLNVILYYIILYYIILYYIILYYIILYYAAEPSYKANYPCHIKFPAFYETYIHNTL